MPVYKERAFQIDVKLVDMSGNTAKLTESCVFKIELYTAETQPNQIKLNTRGDKVMRGTI